MSSLRSLNLHLVRLAPRRNAQPFNSISWNKLIAAIGVDQIEIYPLSCNIAPNSKTSETMENSEQYQRFIAWQCRLRKHSVRELGGKPTAGMSAGVYSISGGDEQSRMSFLIVRKDSVARTDEFRHIVRKTPDSSEWIKNGLRILSELHYHETEQFDSRLTALFSLDSTLADALLEAGRCHLKFAEKSVDYGFDFDVASLADENQYFQATYWHNRLFNPTLPGQVRILGFTPRLDDEA